MGGGFRKSKPVVEWLPLFPGPIRRSVSGGWASVGFMDVEPEQPVAPNVQTTLSEAGARADAAWASLQEHGSSFGEHPLSGLLESAAADADAHRSDVA